MEKYLAANSYPGRGVLLGLSPDGGRAVAAYFIMGRSVNSRNRVFVAEGDGLRTEAHDAALLSDPSLIIYAPVRQLGQNLIVTNGDQTDTVYEALSRGESFEQALSSREFEPDAPNYTPRISGLAELQAGGYAYRLSILKKGELGGCQRFYYHYDQPVPGIGQLIHTYSGDGDPLPSFSGEPVTVALPDDIDALAALMWRALNEDNKVALFVRYTELASGRYEQRIINKHQ